MKTTSFLGLFLLVFLFTACDAEREAELTRPNPEVLKENGHFYSATTATEVQVFESVETQRDPDEDRLSYDQAEVRQDPPTTVLPQTKQRKQPNPAKDTEQ